MTDLSASGRVNPRVLLVLAGLGGVVLGLLLLGTMSDGDEAQSVRSPSRPAGSQRPEPSVPDTSNAEAAQPPALIGRDPFVQLITEPAAQAAGQSGPPREASGGQGARVGEARAGDQPVSAPPSPPASAEAGSSAGGQPAGGGGEATLELQAIARDEAGIERATILVEGETFTPAVGEAFSYGFRLERIIGNCVEASSGASRATMCVPSG